MEIGARTVGFSLLSSGVFRGEKSLVDVLRIGIRSILESCDKSIVEVALVAFTDEEQEALLSATTTVSF